MSDAPPSACRTCPVTKPASSVHGRKTTSPTSAGVASRRIGVHPPSRQARIPSWAPPGSARGTPPSTGSGAPSTGPGLTALTEIRRGPSATVK
jgi:hypothetical protein